MAGSTSIASARFSRQMRAVEEPEHNPGHVPDPPTGAGASSPQQLFRHCDALQFDHPADVQGQTPAQLSLEKVAPLLLQAAATQADAGGAQPGGKYILFVTDSETDFCDDGDAVCPADAVIAKIEKLYGEGIQTLILGIDSTLTSISGPVLQSFANAGVGIMPLAPPNSAGGTPLMASDIYNQCQGVPGWKTLFTAAGLTSGQALGTYAAPDAAVNNATVYSPDVTNVADLTAKISEPPGAQRAAVSLVKLAMSTESASESTIQNFRPATVSQWNFTMQQQLSNSLTFQIGYVGQRGAHLLNFEDIAQSVR